MEMKSHAAYLAIDIENLMHFQTKQNPKDYGEKARSLIFNLKDAKNPRLRIRLLYGELTAIQLVQAESKDLASDSKKEERDKTQEANLAARRSDWNFERQKE